MPLSSELFHNLTQFFSQEAAKLLIALVYLFGSRAEERAGPGSDYDLAIFFSQEPPARERHALAYRIGRLLEADRVDLVVLNRAPIELRYSVIATGYSLYEASPLARVEFEAQTLSRYFDYLPVLRRQRKEILEEQYETGIQRYRAALRETQDVLGQIRTA